MQFRNGLLYIVDTPWTILCGGQVCVEPGYQRANQRAAKCLKGHNERTKGFESVHYKAFVVSSVGYLKDVV